MKLTHVLLICSALLSLFGCQANPYTQFYTSVITPQESTLLRPYSGHTDFLSAPQSDLKLAGDKLRSQGYTILGYASFEANAQDYGPQLHEKAKELSADVVLLSSSYAGNVSGVRPIINYQPGQTSTTNSSGRVNANVYNNRGSSAYGTATYSGQSTTTSPGTFTTDYVPYSVERHNYGASFWRKRTFIFGAGWMPLTTEQRQALQRNTGLVVTGLVEGSPAFIANILTDDILLTIDGDLVTTDEIFREQINTRAGKKVTIGVLRKEKEISIDVQLGDLPTH